jgi:PAS domain S-box-containing protein
MSLKNKIWLILGLLMFALSGINAVLDYSEAQKLSRAEMHQEALDLRAVLMATRRVYHKQFMASGLPLNEQTLGFLPAHAMSRIAQDYPNWTKSGVSFNNVSDRPRNPANQADADDLAAMAWFRANPKAEEYTTTIRDRAGKEYFHFAAPIWTEPYCLECHASPESAPPTIRARYEAGYGYRAGDLRGVMSIRIPTETGRQLAMAHWQGEMGEEFALLLVVLVTLGMLLNRFVTRRIAGLQDASRRMSEGDYTVRLADTTPDEIGQLARGFDIMAGAIEQRGLALSESEEKYRILADFSSEWEYWLGSDGRYRYVSRACERITGHGPEEFLADAGLMGRLLHPDDLAAWQSHIQAHDDPVRPVHTTIAMRIRSSDGEYHWIEHACVSVFDANGRYLGRRGVNRDITERKRSEELERFSAFQAGIAEMSTSILHNIGNAITAVTQDAEIIDHAGAELLRVAGLLEANATHSQEELAGPAGQTRSHSQLAQRQCAIQLEAARAINRLYEEEMSQRARRLGESVRHIADIVRIQQSAALPDGQRSTFSLSQAIRSALELQGDAFDKRGIQVTVAVDPAVDLVSLPHNRMLQALVNIIRNSVEAIDERGQPGDVPNRIDIRAESLGAGRMRLTVLDTGTGFAAEAREQLFRFGYSSKQRGSGFGLHSVAVFAQEVGGEVALESEGPDRGASMALELPISTHKATDRQDAASPISSP